MKRPKKETASTNKPDPAVAELIAAIAEGDEERLRRMVAAGADLQAIDEDGVSVLEHAIRNGSPSVMMSLFSAEPLTDAPEDEERSPEQELAEAIRSGDLKTARRLLEEGASPNQKLPFGMTAVHLAALMQETPILRLLLQEGGDPNIRNETGNTPLFMAETGDDVRALVEAGADANARNELGSTPLFSAASGDVIRALVEAGAKVNARDGFGETPLHCAANADCVQTLLAMGADIAARSGFRRTPPHRPHENA